jgi:hypothetical protein
MSVKLKQNNHYIKRPDINTLKEIARSVNDAELPVIPDNQHILLPTQEQALLKNNYQIYSEELFNIFNKPDKSMDNKLQEELEYNKKNYFLKTKRKEHAEVEKDVEIPRKRQRLEEDDRSQDNTSNIQKSVNNFEDVMGEEESIGEGFLMHRDNSDMDYNYDF